MCSPRRLNSRMHKDARKSRNFRKGKARKRCVLNSSAQSKAKRRHFILCELSRISLELNATHIHIFESVYKHARNIYMYTELLPPDLPRCWRRRRLGNRCLRVTHWVGDPRRVIQRKVVLSGRQAATWSSSTPRLGPTTCVTHSRRPLVRRASVDARLERHPRPPHARAASRLGLQVRSA